MKIGLATTLTGAYSTSGEGIRNGVMLAVEQVNEEGGIHGRPVELIVKDDEGDPDAAVRVDSELIEEGVVAIIGHFLSTLSIAVQPLLSERDILMLPVGSISAGLSGIDDTIIRITTPSDKRMPFFTTLIYDRRKFRKMLVVYDLSNSKLSEYTYQAFRKEFEARGGDISGVIRFDPREVFSAPDIVEQIAASDADGVFLLTSAIHGALICQHLRRTESRIAIFASPWGFRDPAFIKTGGSAVNGVVCLSQYYIESSDADLQNLKSEYARHYSVKFSAANLMGYEATRVLFYALLKTDNPKELKPILLEKKTFKPVGREITIDEFGDAIRAMHILEIQDGKVTTRGKIEPSELLKRD